MFVNLLQFFAIFRKFREKILKSLEKSDAEFLLVDVRENEEISLADIPQRNEVLRKNP